MKHLSRKACLADQVLMSLLEDSLSKGRHADVTGHVQECASCQARLETICVQRAVIPAQSIEPSTEESEIKWSGNLAKQLIANILSAPDGSSLDSQTLPHVPASNCSASDEEMVSKSEQTIARGGGYSKTSVTRRQVEHEATFTELKIGEMFGRYRIKKILGQGAMGAVYLARDTHLDRDIALKIPKFGNVHESNQAEILERFYREARASATLRNPHICPVYDVGELDGQHYISMAFIAGRPLKDFTRSKKQHPERQIAMMIRKLALGLAESHEIGVVHRDLKPANIMVDEKGQPVVMDFGLARRNNSEDVKVTRQNSILGTPAYMSPEQVAGEQSEVGHQTDIYSLGVIMYELITGEMPFKGNLMKTLQQIAISAPVKPSRIRSDIDPRLEAICLKMMAGDKSVRYQSMSDVADELLIVSRNSNRDKSSPEAQLDLSDRLSDSMSYQDSNPAHIALDQPPSDVEELGRNVRQATVEPRTDYSSYIGTRRLWLLYGAVVTVALILLFSTLIVIRTKDGAITLEIPDGFEDRVVIEVVTEGNAVGKTWIVTPDQQSKTLQVQTGKIKLTIKDGYEQDYQLSPDEFTLGDHQVIKLTHKSSKQPISSSGGTPVEQAESETDEIDILAAIDLERDALLDQYHGEWRWTEKTLVSPRDRSGVIVTNIASPLEFELTAVVERMKGSTGLAFGIVVDGFPCTVGIDVYNPVCSGLELIDSKYLPENETKFSQPLLSKSGRHKVHIIVRKRSVRASVDGIEFLNWKGDPSRLSYEGASPDRWKVWFQAVDSQFKFHELKLQR